MIERHRLPGYAVGVGSKGCVTFSPTRIVDYETFKANQDVAVTELAWLWNMNRGIYMTPGREEEWTLSVTHTDEAIDDYVRVVRRDGGSAHRLSAARRCALAARSLACRARRGGGRRLRRLRQPAGDDGGAARHGRPRDREQARAGRAVLQHRDATPVRRCTCGPRRSAT